MRLAQLAAIACGTLLGYSLLSTHTAILVYSQGISLVAPVIGVAIYAVVMTPVPAINWFLVTPLVRFIGRISYGLYLWHWPLYQLVLTPSRMNGGTLAMARLTATALVSISFFWLIEQRFLRLKTRYGY